MKIDMEVYVADTHGLVWFITEDDRLSEHAKRLFEQAENAEIQVLIPTIVLAETAYIAQKKRTKVTIDEGLEFIDQGSGFAIVPFDFSIFQIMLQLPNDWEIHDRIIGSTTRYYKATLITKDMVLRNSEEAKTTW